jgi:hypothetical protein
VSEASDNGSSNVIPVAVPSTFTDTTNTSPTTITPQDCEKKGTWWEYMRDCSAISRAVEGVVDDLKVAGDVFWRAYAGRPILAPPGTRCADYTDDPTCTNPSEPVRKRVTGLVLDLGIGGLSTGGAKGLGVTGGDPTGKSGIFQPVKDSLTNLFRRENSVVDETLASNTTRPRVLPLGLTGKLTGKTFSGKVVNVPGGPGESVTYTLGSKISTGGTFATRGVYEVRIIKYLDGVAQSDMPMVAKIFAENESGITIMQSLRRYLKAKEVGLPVPDKVLVDLDNKIMLIQDLNANGLVAVSPHNPTSLVADKSVFMPNIDEISLDMAEKVLLAGRDGLSLHYDTSFLLLPATRPGVANARTPIRWIIGDFDQIEATATHDGYTMGMNVVNARDALLDYIKRYAIPAQADYYVAIVERNIDSILSKYGLPPVKRP